MPLWRKLFSATGDEKKKENSGIFHPGLALRRLMYVAGIGSFLISVYGFRYGGDGAATIFSVISSGLMAGGAALLTGGLLGFLFGVPHTRNRAQVSVSASVALARRGD